MSEVRTDERLAWLRREVTQWESTGLITDDQASRILALYSGQDRLAARTQVQGRIVAVLGVLGAILVALGVILFFAANWQALPRWSKFSLVLGATIGAYLLGYWLRFSRKYTGVGGAVLLLGALLYGSGIFLIGQMFHVQAEPHYGLLLWAVGILPLGYVLPLNAMIALAALLTAVWASVVGFFGLERYGLNGEAYIGVPLRTALAAGIALYGVGVIHTSFPASRPFGRPYRVTGVIVIFLAYYVYTTFITNVDPRMSLAGPGVLPWSLLSLQAGLAAVGVVLFLGYLGVSRDRYSLPEFLALEVLLLATWIVPPALPALGAVARLLTSGGLWFVVINLLLFGSCLGATTLGVQRGDRALVNVGLTFFAVGVATRYIDVFGQMLERSLFFIGGGVLLLGGGWLVERTRRRLLRQMEVAGQ